MARTMILAGAVAVVAAIGGVNTFLLGDEPDGKIAVNSLAPDAPNTDWSTIENADFTLRPTTEGTGPAPDG